MKIHADHIGMIASQRGDDCAAAFLAQAKKEGAMLSLPEEQWREIARKYPRRTGLGDLIEKAVKPIAKAMHHPCLDEQAQLRPGSPCAKIRDALNRAVPLGAAAPAAPDAAAGK